MTRLNTVSCLLILATSVTLAGDAAKRPTITLDLPATGALKDPYVLFHVDANALRRNPWLSKEEDARGLNHLFYEFFYVFFAGEKYKTLKSFQASMKKSHLSIGNIGSLSLMVAAEEPEDRDMLPFLLRVRFNEPVTDTSMRFPVWKNMAATMLMDEIPPNWSPRFEVLGGRHYVAFTEDADAGNDSVFCLVGFSDNKTMLLGTREEILTYQLEGKVKKTVETADPVWLRMRHVQEDDLLLLDGPATVLLGWPLFPILVAGEMAGDAELPGNFAARAEQAIEGLDPILNGDLLPEEEPAADEGPASASLFSAAFPEGVVLRSQLSLQTSERAEMLLDAIEKHKPIEILNQHGMGGQAVFKRSGRIIRFQRNMGSAEHDALRHVILQGFSDIMCMMGVEIHAAKKHLSERALDAALRYAQGEERKEEIRQGIEELKQEAEEEGPAQDQPLPTDAEEIF